ncbi:MAG: cytochrome c oxidase subunit II [Polyangiaceae bacterium]
MNPFLLGLLDLPPEASTFAAAIDLLHICVIATTMVGATFVFLLALYFLFRYRRRPGRELSPRLSTPLRAELSIIAALQILFLGFWVVGAIQYNHLMSPPAGAMPIYVTAKQWMWKFAYPDGRSSIDVLTVPVNRPIKLVMTSRDVIHSFYVPAFRMKHDVVPGRYYAAWFQATTPGTFDLDCTEYCGLDHSRMLGKIRVLSSSDYEHWLESHKVRTLHASDAPNEPGGLSGNDASDLADAGRSVAARRGCLACHTLDGQPHIGPTWAGLLDSPVKLTDGSTVVADEAYLTRSMMDPQAQVVDGYKPVMPTYRGILQQPEVAALLELMKAVAIDPDPRSVELPKVTPLTVGEREEPKP